MHPLFGRLLPARSLKRWNGALLVVELPDGSTGTIGADATVKRNSLAVLCTHAVRRRGCVTSLSS
jgi:hypothetical protein